MNCNNRISATALLAAASLTFSAPAWSLGLGEATVDSYLNQPLKARIDLVSQAGDDLKSVTARLASAADYELIGASREAVSVPIRFTVEDVDGDAYISATSALPIGDPVLRLIVEVNWSSGRMLREYTLFLDPPAVPEPAPAPRMDQRGTARAPAPAAPSAAEPAPPPAARATVASPAPAEGGEYGPVRNGETLWGIASDWSRGTGMNINQVMIAIQQRNPNAFLNENINLLKRGAILRMPSAADVADISAARAYREVQEQEDAFTGRKAAAPVTSPATPLLADQAAGPAAAETEAAPAEPMAEPAVEDAATAAETAEAEAAEAEAAEVAEAQDVLELVPPSEQGELDSAYGFEEAEEGAESDLDVQALRENLARTEEELINQQQQNSYLEERISELEAQLESAETSRVADADLANMEDRLRDQRAAAADEEGPWYSRLSVWLVGLLVLIAALAGWLISRRGQAASDEAAAAAEESLRGLKSEAEDVLRVLGEEEAEEAGPVESRSAAEAPESAAPAEPPKRRAAPDEDAELLDEASSDPEIQLDLARAYISMGDKEAARVILDEVTTNGNEEQQAEARAMLDTL